MRSVYSHQSGREEAHKIFRRNPRLFALGGFETRQLESLMIRGYAPAPSFFSKELVDRIHTKADTIFHNAETEAVHAHGAPKRQSMTLTVALHSHASAGERSLEIKDPLVHISEALDIVFHESILKVVAHFFRQIPPVYRVAIVRDFPCGRPPHLSTFRQETYGSDSLQIVINLVDVDQNRGPLVYVPGSNLHRSSPRLLSAFGLPANQRLLEDEEVEHLYPRTTWETLYGGRGSIALIHKRGIHKGPTWVFPGDPNNKSRTTIRIDINGYGPGTLRHLNGNSMRKWNFDRMSALQRLFAHPSLLAEEIPA